MPHPFVLYKGVNTVLELMEAIAGYLSGMASEKKISLERASIAMGVVFFIGTSISEFVFNDAGVTIINILFALVLSSSCGLVCYGLLLLHKKYSGGK